MPRHHETRYLPYTAGQMFDLVADVGRYADFLPWIIGVRVRSDSEQEMVADVIVGFKGLRERFTSRVAKTRPLSIHVDYVDGPLKHLRNDWTFEDDGAGGCTIDFSVDFAFKNSLFERLAGQMFDKALRRMISAFEERADALYAAVQRNPSLSGNSSSSANSAA